MKHLCASALSITAAAATLAADYQPSRAGFDFPIYTNKPPGRQITSGQLPATTHALAPEETRKLIEVPPGFEVRLFAAEPMVVNPVAITWDERGRLWVVELYEYPKGAPKGEKGRDRIKILEDTDADGKADKVTVFADGYSLATGIALGNGGVYLGQAPHLYFLEDTNGDDRMDKQTILKTGFGMEDRHELLNGFAWGPDGWLYMTHGVFTHSKVRDPDAHDPDGFGVQMDAALARFHPVTRKFEVFADGTSNPWGVDWNERGDAFVSACVIQHLFHMAPGGQYNRQGGTWANPYGYVGDLPSKGLPAIVDWRHHRAAHSGICVYQGDQWPAEWRGLVFLGNIHQSALNCDRLIPVGSTYKAERESTLLGPAGEALHKKSGEQLARGEEWKHLGPGNFFVSRDPWVRPVSNQTGPDGAMWVMDWYDKYPCYQNAQADPEGVDRVYGRIWRVVWTGDQPGKPVPSRPSREMNLTKSSALELAGLLEHPNNWHRRQAQRLIAEKFHLGSGNNVDAEIANLNAWLKARMLGNEASETKLAGFWTASIANLLGGGNLNSTAKDQNPVIRAWTARLTGARSHQEAVFPARLIDLARDSDATVRAAVAVAARQFTSDSLTVDTSPHSGIAADVTPVLEELLARPSVEGDFYYPHIVWMAMEPRVAANPQPFFPLLAANDNSVSAYCARRVMRRICDLSDATMRGQHLNSALLWLGDNATKTQIAGAALDGLIEAMKSKGAPPTIDLAPIFAKLTANPALAEKARRLATLLGDTSASRVLLAKINDAQASVEDRLKGVQAARDTKDEASRSELLRLIATEKQNQPLLTEGLRALSTFGGDDIGYAITDAWKKFNLPTRRIASEVLVIRSKWSRALLAAVEQKVANPQDISATARRALARSEDATVRDNAERLLGRYRATDADKLKLIAEKKRIVLSGTPDLNNGHEVAKRTCYVCHKLYGEGADIGPDLTGVGRSTLDALLHNVIDPNEVIGNGFEVTEVTLKDDSTISGRVVEETDTRIKLVASGPMEHVIAKSDIKVVNGKPAIRKTELSLMPEGLEQIPDKDFRDMIMFILNPPGDERPWTPALRKELIGDEPRKSASAN
jgi:putative membrane-bound dehydrogenase-like protein